MELGTIIWWTLAIMINDLSICPHYNISDRRKVHSIIETSDRSVSSPWLYWSDGPRDGQLFPWWFIITILQVLFDVWLWAVFVIIVFFCFNCRHHPGRRMVTGHNSQPMTEKWLITFKMPNHYIAFQTPKIIELDLQSTGMSCVMASYACQESSATLNFSVWWEVVTLSQFTRLKFELLFGMFGRCWEMRSCVPCSHVDHFQSQS